MLKNSLLEILRTFSKDELKRFDEFVYSPYFNKKTPVIKLWEFIKKYSPEFKNENLERENAWKKLFPTKEFNYGVMKNLIFDLTRLSESFLVSERLNSNEFQKKYELIETLLDRDLKDLFVSKFDNLEKTSMKLSFDNKVVREDFYYFMWRSYMSKWNFENQLIHSKDYEDVINLSSDFFLAFFLIQSFLIYHNIEGQKVEHNYNNNCTIEYFLKNAYQTGLIADLIKSIKPVSQDVSNVLNVYYKMFVSISNKNSVEKYFDFKKICNE